ncbi:lysophospholipid acyltransferase family protein [Pedobacter caeni]|uniref:KDO2-lipid IV(A) lauroyltransferase n=1 Tax=Pedobacter caeni TaxID=288992 RepID=A0A1M5L8R6_9SPHI|nr:lauroyl acyltransferase [Pedobacter caeni]SHG61401.1 KDO2-lipid IV(A) lauroyltransferase [Pedobacter caeni]
MIEQQGNPSETASGHLSFASRMASKAGIFILNTLSRLPLSLLYFFAGFIYILIYYVLGYRKKVVRENLKNAFPDKKPNELKQIEKAYFRHLSRIIVEIFKMRTITPKELGERVRFKNIDLIRAYLDQDQSIMLCSPHYGNWEWSVMALGLQVKNHIYTIYKPLNNNIFDRWFYQMRNRYGNTMVPMRNTLRAIKSSENETTIFCFANDQAPPKEESHYWVDFLNQPTSFHLGVEKIAQKTKRPVFYASMKSIRKGYYEMEFIPISLHPEEALPKEITHSYAEKLQSTLIEEPPYWLWSHKRWKHKPDPSLVQPLQ